MAGAAHDSHHGHDGHGHGHDNVPHGSLSDYVKGFVWSVILTAIPFAVVMSGGFESRSLTALVVLGFAAVQIVVHIIYFLHMNARVEGGWTMTATVFTIIVVVIMFSGSVWVMYNMNTHMMPHMMDGMESLP